MSRETAEWLNRHTLIGFTAKRGNAWHYREDLQGDEPNHFAGAVPVADVERRLFDWEPVSVPLSIPVGERTVYDADMEREDITTYHEIEGKVAIVPSNDPTKVFGIFSDSYQPHGYKEWLIGNVSNMLSDTLNISSAGLLSNGAIAWVEISVPDTIQTPEGIAFRPNLLATTSLNGKVATTYKRTCTFVVCDNTWAGAMGEKGQTYKRKHTRNSAGKMEQDKAREALNLIQATADAVSEELRTLTQIEVTRKEFDTITMGVLLEEERKANKGKPVTEPTKLQLTNREKKIEAVTGLYLSDARVAPWNGTAFGVMQAWNTWAHHVKPTRGDTERAERNMMDTITDGFAESDAKVWAEITKVLDLTPATV